MAQRWTPAEERQKYAELERLYVRDNKTIFDIAKVLHIAPQTVFQRLQRLGITTTPSLKVSYAARRRGDIVIPDIKTEKLAEFFGIMFGDGHLAPYQVMVTLGTKEILYVQYVSRLLRYLFGVTPKIGIRRNGYRDVYIGSVDLVEWLKGEGLVHNKVALQVCLPNWLFTKKEFLIGFLRGFFDTDGSIYKLRFGVQLSFTNRSLPLLAGIQRAFRSLGYSPSKSSLFRVYLTRRQEIVKFFKEVQPANQKHRVRYKAFIG